MPALYINRAELADYIKKNIDTLLENADIDLQVHDTEVTTQQMEFTPTIRVRIEGIPLSDLGGKSDGEQ